MSNTTGNVRIGTSGYVYDHWRGVFYPEDIPKKQWFEHYCTRFDTVEINNTFYHLPQAETFDRWHERAPDHFCYVLKFSRYGTQLKRLKDPADSIGAFLERAERLGSQLGPILVQLPPRWKANPPRLAAFLEAVPKTHRWAVEFRDPSWLCDEVYDILRRHHAALCIHDMIQGHPRLLTADWTYLRFHGDRYSGSYNHESLSAAAKEIQRWRDGGRDVFVFFNNDAEGFAVQNALDLRSFIGTD